MTSKEFIKYYFSLYKSKFILVFIFIFLSVFSYVLSPIIIGKLIDNLEFTKASEVRIKNYILSKTKIQESQLDANYRKDWWIFAEEAIEYGIADEIITDILTLASL